MYWIFQWLFVVIQELFFIREVCQRFKVYGYYWGSLSLFCLVGMKFQMFRRKVGVWYKLFCLYKQFGYGGFVFIGNGRSFFVVQVQVFSEGQFCQQFFEGEQFQVCGINVFIELGLVIYWFGGFLCLFDWVKESFQFGFFRFCFFQQLFGVCCIVNVELFFVCCWYLSCFFCC